MSVAIRLETTGGPGVMKLVEVEVGSPGRSQVRLRQTAIGFNYIDTYHRTGFYPLPLPSGLGVEAAGVVEAVGEDGGGVQPGDRVAYAGGAPGAYAEERLYPADRLVPIPPGITDEQAAAVLFKGITAQYLIRAACPVKPGMTILVYAAAGGVGSLLTAWASHLGAVVIGVVTNEGAVGRVLANGCAHAIVWGKDDLPARVRDLTGGQGVDVAYDSVGADTWSASLDALRRRGMMVSFGSASGPVPAFDTALLSKKGSLFLTRPSIADYIADTAEYQQRAAEVLEALAAGVIRTGTWKSYGLDKVREAHADLEARRTSGPILLLPPSQARHGGLVANQATISDGN